VAAALIKAMDTMREQLAALLVRHQRDASGRPDVVTFISDTLTTPMRISGEPIANLVASTTGTDAGLGCQADRRYPDEVGGDAAMGGYQLG